MTETQSHYITPGNHNLHIPSRDEFHRYATDKLTDFAFCTDYPSAPGSTADRIAKSLRWTVSNAKQVKHKGWKRNANKQTE